MRISFGGAASVATALIGVASRLLPHERVVYRVEDPKTGKTIGVFTSVSRAERLGEPIEDLLNPRLIYRSIVQLNPLGEITRRGTVAFRHPPEDGFTITGFGDGEALEVVAASEKSVALAESYAQEGLRQLRQDLGSRVNGRVSYAYGRLQDAREGFGLVWSSSDRVRIFRHGNCALSQESLEDARDIYRRRTL